MNLKEIQWRVKAPIYLENTKESKTKKNKRKEKKRSYLAPVEKWGSTSVINIYYLWHLLYIENAEQTWTDLYNIFTICDTHNYGNYSRGLSMV